jgi:superfamily II DNA helicase RecQ
LYLAPERLQAEATRQLLEDVLEAGQVVALAVDEALTNQLGDLLRIARRAPDRARRNSGFAFHRFR